MPFKIKCKARRKSLEAKNKKNLYQVPNSDTRQRASLLSVKLWHSAKGGDVYHR
jgi:hypothetical protein